MDENVPEQIPSPIPPSEKVSIPQKTSTHVTLLIVGLTIFLIAGMCIAIFLLGKNRPSKIPPTYISDIQKQKNISKDTFNSQEESKNNLSVIYAYTHYSTILQRWEPSEKIISDITNTKKASYTATLMTNVHSPSYKQRGVLERKTFAIVTDNTPSPKTLIDISQVPDTLDLGGVVWSPDENSLAYEVRVDHAEGSAVTGNLKVQAEADYYTINIDGSNKKLVGKITNYTGGGMFGYDFANSIVYLTRNNFGAVENTTIIALDTKTNTQKELITMPIGSPVSVSLDHKYLYYITDNKIITQLDVHNNTTKPYFSIDQEAPSSGYTINNFYFSPDESLLFISGSPGTAYYKYIVHTKTMSVDKALADPIYSNFYLKELSPDNKYIFLQTYRKDLKEDDPNIAKYGVNSFYASKTCLWDIEAKKLIPFFNCKLVNGNFVDEEVNSDIVLNTWLVNK